MDYRTILVEHTEGLALITLNRPERLNAWTYEMGAELAVAVAAANADEDVIAIVVTGAGRGFCAGADIEAVFKAQADDGASSASSKASTSSRRPGDWVQLVRASKPMVAAINGAAIGVGLTQVLPMDYLVAASGAKLSMRFVKMGLVPELASSHFLALRMGIGHAGELMLSGRTVLAEEALALGLVDRVVATVDLLATACTVARGMGENPQSALRMIKQLLTENASEVDLIEVQKREMKALTQSYATPEHKEAISAFLEKREPDFRGARQKSD